MNEAGLQRKVIQYLKQHNIWHVKTKESNRSGIPDIIGCKKGKFFAVELKSPDNYNKATKLQEYEIMMIEQSKGAAIVSRSYYDITKFIEGL